MPRGKRNPPNIVKNGVVYKWCSHCGEYRSVDNFHPATRSKDGLRPYCKDYDSKASVKSRALADKTHAEIMEGEFVRRFEQNISENWQEFFPQLRAFNVGHCPDPKVHFMVGLHSSVAHAHVNASDPYFMQLCFSPHTLNRHGPWTPDGYPTETMLHEYAHLLSRGDGHFALWKAEFKKQLARFGYKIPFRINRFTSCHAGHYLKP